MIEIQKHMGPYGIPIFYQRMPEMVKSVSLSWVMFTGAADDTSVALPGLYHWFEHVPFRGTKKFPGGVEATQGWATRFNGHIGAWTNMLRTKFDAYVPVHVWEKGFEVITDLVAQPLVKDESVIAERDVIRQEIAFTMSQPMKNSFIKLAEILYAGHPFGNPILGTEATLDAMDASTLQKAWNAGYDRSRLALTCVGNIPLDKLTGKLEELCPILPDNSLSERRRPVSYGVTPKWNSGGLTTVETTFRSSLVFMVFPIIGESQLKRYYDVNMLDDLFTSGGLASPLYKIVRDEHKLAYATKCTTRSLPDNNYFSFCVETKKENIEEVTTVLNKVINSTVVRSKKRLEEVQENTSNFFKMRAIDPEHFAEIAVNRYVDTGDIVNDSDYEIAMNGYTEERIASLLEQLTLERAHTIVLKGMG